MLGVKNIRILVEIFFFYQFCGYTLFFVKPLALQVGTSVRGTGGLILVRKNFSCFNFYSVNIDRYLKRGFFHQSSASLCAYACEAPSEGVHVRPSLVDPARPHGSLSERASPRTQEGAKTEHAEGKVVRSAGHGTPSCKRPLP